MPDFAIISADSHVSEPPDLWVQRMDRKYRERAPRNMRVLPAPSQHLPLVGIVRFGRRIVLSIRTEELGSRSVEVLVSEPMSINRLGHNPKDNVHQDRRDECGKQPPGRGSDSTTDEYEHQE